MPSKYTWIGRKWFFSNFHFPGIHAPSLPIQEENLPRKLPATPKFLLFQNDLIWHKWLTNHKSSPLFNQGAEIYWAWCHGRMKLDRVPSGWHCLNSTGCQDVHLCNDWITGCLLGHGRVKKEDLVGGGEWSRNVRMRQEVGGWGSRSGAHVSYRWL